MIDVPNYLIVSQSAVRVAFFAVLALVGFAAIQRSPLSDKDKWRFGTGLALVGFAWLLLATTLAVRGVFLPGALGPFFPGILPAMLVPVLVFSVVLARSQRANAVLDAMPHSWLIRVQVMRVLGGTFVLLYLDGRIPGEFAIPAGFGDMAVGLLALPVAYMVSHGLRWARPATFAWNVFGILDLVSAGTLGFLTSPGPFQQLALDSSNTIITQYPLVMIPVYAVPVALVLHILSLRKLFRKVQQGRLATA